jgi:hypothetical protein
MNLPSFAFCDSTRIPEAAPTSTRRNAPSSERGIVTNRTVARELGRRSLDRGDPVG